MEKKNIDTQNKILLQDIKIKNLPFYQYYLCRDTVVVVLICVL